MKFFALPLRFSFLCRGMLPAGLLAILSLVSGCTVLYNQLGGKFAGEPQELESEISVGARRMLYAALDGVDTPYFVDFHVHHLSQEANPRWSSPCHPVAYGRTRVYLDASGVKLSDHLTEDYIQRLVRLATELPKPGRLYLYALDRYYHPDGKPDPDRTQIYVSNESVVEVARRYPEIFVPVVSVHPYRKDAIPALRKWAAAGCRHVKWIPNSMGIVPSDPRLDEYYRTLKELDMILLTHTGDEHGLEAEGTQYLGNPLLLRRTLDLGVTVVALHAAGNGLNQDLDSPNRELVPSYTLLFRMLENPEYDDLLYAGMAGLTFFNHLPEPLLTLLARPDLQSRLVPGSDYPFSAINVVTWPQQLVNLGLISREEAGFLREIYSYNPLVFDFVLKRTVRHPKTGRPFSPSVFILPDRLR